MRKNILILTILSIFIAMAQDIDNDSEDIAIIEPETFSARSSGPSFSRSKRILATKIYRFHQKTFYGGCDYEIKANRLIPIHETCGFHFRKNPTRASRIEWEHIVPAWYFGHNLDCWREGGRTECRSSNPKFREMEADMHNLAPAIGEINGDRSNYPYGNIRGEKREYGKVDIEIDSSNRLAEPKRSILGDIARVYLYMRDKYHIPLSLEDEKRFIKWNNSDPVTRWEKKKNLLVKEYQGDDNRYISDYKKLTKLEPLPTQVDNRESNISKNQDSFTDIKDDLERRLSPIFEILPKPVASILIFIMALLVLYFRKKRS